MNLPTVVSREEWLAARKDLLAKEKAATRARDALNAASCRWFGSRRTTSSTHRRASAVYSTCSTAGAS